MATEHLDRLSALDASFLAQERNGAHMHVGAIALVDGPPPPIEALLGHVRARLDLVPRYRQKLAYPPFDSGRPVWVDDPTFNIAYHVRHTALAPPGDEAALLRMAARVFSQQLDRAKPLWELWVVEGLAGGGFALVSKSHHALVDGISGLDVASVLFDLEPDRAPAPERVGSWIPQPEPSPAHLAAIGAAGAMRRASDLAIDAAAAAARPLRLLGRARAVATGFGEVAWSALSAPPETPLDVAPGHHRRLAVVRAPLADLRAVKAALGGTVNDVVLSVIAGGLASFLQARGRRTDDLELKACLPLSVQPDAQRGELGNHLTQVIAPLPLFLDDPVARLRYVRNAMVDVKESNQALGAEAIVALEGLAPPSLLAQASRLTFMGRLYNLLVTNIPGPQVPLYLLGHRLESMVGIPFLAGDRALAVSVMSYDGGVTFGLLADYDAVSDLDVLAGGIEAAIADLVTAARRAGPLPRDRRPAEADVA